MNGMSRPAKGQHATRSARPTSACSTSSATGRPPISGRTACAAIPSVSRLPRGTSRQACRMVSPDRPNLPRRCLGHWAAGPRAGTARHGPARRELHLGWGAAGYGPRRLRDIRAAAGERLEPSLRRALDAVERILPHQISSPDTHVFTAAMTIRTGPRPTRGRGAGCTGSGRRFSRSSCTSARPAR